MLKKIISVLKSIFTGLNVKTEVRNQKIDNSPNSVNIIGDNNNVTKGPHISMDEEQEALVIKEID